MKTYVVRRVFSRELKLYTARSKSRTISENTGSRETQNKKNGLLYLYYKYFYFTFLQHVYGQWYITNSVGSTNES